MNRARSLTAHYTFVDYATQGYLALVALVMLLFHNDRTPLWPVLFTAHLGVMGLVHGLIQLHGNGRGNRVVDFLRHFYPILLYTGFYRETEELNRMFFDGYLDPILIRAEQGLFGLQPSLAFMEWAPWLIVSEVFYAAYFSYYIMIVGVGFALLFRDRAQFFHYVSVVSFVFYVCYFTYIILPVLGARFFYHETLVAALPEGVGPALIPGYPEAIQSGLFYQLMRWVYTTFEAEGAAFPSSHVAIALTTLWFSYRYLRPIRGVHLAAVLLLCASTVYCRYHYVIDVFAGVVTAAILIPAGHKLYLKSLRKPVVPALEP